MRIGAGWISSKEGWDDLPDELVPTWLTIGFFVADLGGLILLVSLIVGGIGVPPTAGKGSGLLRATMALARAPGGVPGRRVGDGRQAGLKPHPRNELVKVW